MTGESERTNERTNADSSRCIRKAWQAKKPFSCQNRRIQMRFHALETRKEEAKRLQLAFSYLCVCVEEEELFLARGQIEAFSSRKRKKSVLQKDFFMR